MEGNAPEDYITEENTARAGRVMKLASELGATPGQVALCRCAPCRVEAPDLQALNEEFSAAGAAAEKSAAKEDLDALDQEFGGREVQFLGINLRDQQATSSAFERSFGITYPSALDTDGSIAMGLSEFVPPQAVPTTVVIDKDGRISARVLGIAEKSTLRALINTAVETSG